MLLISFILTVSFAIFFLLILGLVSFRKTYFRHALSISSILSLLFLYIGTQITYKKEYIDVEFTAYRTYADSWEVEVFANHIKFRSPDKTYAYRWFNSKSSKGVLIYNKNWLGQVISTEFDSND